MMKPEHIMHAIAAEITRHEEELERLKVARDVLTGLFRDASPLKDLSVKPAPMFTVVRKASKPKTTKRGAVRAEVLRLLDKDEYITTRDVTHHIYGDAPTMPQQKSVWNAMTAMVKKGEALRTGTGIYVKPSRVIPPKMEQSA